MHTASEERSSEQLQLRRRSAAVTLERCFRGLHDRSIYHAALEHRPLFQLAMSIRDSDGNPVFFQREEGRPFSEQHTVKVLLGEEYEVALELDDLGRTVTAVESVDIDAQQLSVSRSSVHHRERTNSYVYALHGHWSPRHVQVPDCTSPKSRHYLSTPPHPPALAPRLTRRQARRCDAASAERDV